MIYKILRKMNLSLINTGMPLLNIVVKDLKNNILLFYCLIVNFITFITGFQGRNKV